MLGEIGLPITLEETVRTFVGRSMASCMRIVEERLGRPAPAGVLEAYNERIFGEFRASLRPVPGIEQALDALELPTCVASSGEHAKMHTTLGVTGLLPRFEGRLFSATEVEHGVDTATRVGHRVEVGHRCRHQLDGLSGGRRLGRSEVEEPQRPAGSRQAWPQQPADPT